MNIETLERKIRDVLAIYGQQVVDFNKLEGDTAVYVKSLTQSALLSGIGTASSLLSQFDGSDTITPQALEAVVMRIAGKDGNRTQNVYV